MIKMIVDNGLNQIRDWMCGESATYPLYIGVGTGTTTETSSDTALESEEYPNGSSRSSTTITSTDYSINFRMDIEDDELNGKTLAEKGLFTASTGGIMYSRQTYPDIEKDSSIVVPTTIKINISSFIP